MARAKKKKVKTNSRTNKSRSNGRCEGNGGCNHKFHFSHITPRIGTMNDSLSILRPNYQNIWVCEFCNYVKFEKAHFHEDDEEDD